MTRQRFALLLVAAFVVIAGALWVSHERNAPRETPGVALLPGLANDLNTVTAVTVRKGSATPTVTLHQTGGEWRVAERAEYPADVAKLRTLLLALRDAKIVEEKTNDPARFTAIGVEDPAAAGATGVEVTLVTPAGRSAVIIGKPLGDGNFVRRVGENRSYSVAPATTLETEPRYWIDSRVLDIAAALIQSIELKPATGGGYALRRLNPADNTFSLDGVPAGRKALEGHALAPAASLLTGLNAEDVAPVASVDFAGPSQLIVTLTDGNVLTITGVAVAEKHWLQVKSTKNAALTAKSDGRAFQIASYRYDALFKPLDQLLEPLPPKPTPASHGPASAAHGPATAPATGPAASPMASPVAPAAPAPPAHPAKKPPPAPDNVAPAPPP